jgi:hypothetical protein
VSGSCDSIFTVSSQAVKPPVMAHFEKVGCVRREIPRPAGENAGLRDDSGKVQDLKLTKLSHYQTTSQKSLAGARSHSYPSFAVMEIFAFRTFDTGQPFSAASAYF